MQGVQRRAKLSAAPTGFRGGALGGRDKAVGVFVVIEWIGSANACLSYISVKQEDQDHRLAGFRTAAGDQ